MVVGALGISAIGFGLITASILAIAAVGFTMQFAITSILNLAYASVMTAASFVAYAVNAAGVNIWLCVPVGAAFGAVFSMLLNRLVYARFAKRGTSAVGLIIVSIGVGLIVQYVVVVIWSPNFVSYRLAQGATVRWGSFAFTGLQLALIAIAVVLMIGLHLLLTRTKLGRAMRATATNASLARDCGIATERIIDLAWLISGALCGIAGVVFAMNIVSFTPASEQAFLVVVIAAAVVGGIGKPYGAMLGALIIGLATEEAALVVNPAYKDEIAFLLLAIVLLVRPQGILSGAVTKEEVAA
jgi:branched-chain amino acid transport system permease protein/neutral amino acid transport system permease protein